MPQYILRNLPADLWAKFSERAEREGWPKRALILQLLEDYAAGRVAPSGAPPDPYVLRLRLGEPLRAGKGPVLGTGDPYQYPVLGLPPGDEATISMVRDHRWQVWRKHGDRKGVAEGTFESAEKALAALSAEYQDPDR